MLDNLAESRRRLAWCLVSLAATVLVIMMTPARPVAALESAVSFAQTQWPSGPSGSGDQASLFDLDSMFMKSLIVIGVFLVAFLFLFFVLYGILVDSARWWPLSAYGLTAGLVVLLTVAAALFAFWDDLIIKRGDDTGVGGFSWFDKMGLRAAVALGGILAFVFLTYVFKSQRGRVAAQ